MNNLASEPPSKPTTEQRIWQAATKPMTLVEIAVAVDASRSCVGAQVRRMAKMGSLERTGDPGSGKPLTYKRVGPMLLSDRRRLTALLQVYSRGTLLAELRRLEQGTYSWCKTIAANAQHLRKLTDAGPKPGGGADTLALCGAKVLWDKPNVPINASTLACDPERAMGNPCSSCVNAYFKRPVRV